MEFNVAVKIPIIIVLDDIRSAYNVGSIFRTADAFLVESIFLCGFTPAPPHREIQKTALGANVTVAWKYFQSIVEAVKELKSAGYRIAVVEQTENSVLLNEFSAQSGEKIALVFGNEIGGVSPEVVDASDVCIEIPQYGTKHSLNISVCAGIVLWDLLLKVKQPF